MADSLSSIPGVSSGIDWKSLVDSIITADRQPAVRMQAQIDAGAKRKTALTDLGTQLRSLQSAADSLNTGSNGEAFMSFTVSATGTDAGGRAVLAATTDATATAGRYDVSVDRLATAAKQTGSVGYAAGAALPTSGTFQLTRLDTSGASRTLGIVAIDASSTLESVRDAVNALNAGTSPSGVSASIINVSDGDRRLVLTAGATGVANGFSLSDDGSGVLNSLGLDSNGTAPPVVQAAADASFTIDGLAMTRSTNTVRDAVTGLTLALGAIGESTIAVDRNLATASDTAQTFVSGYNKMVATLKTQTNAGQPLAGDSLARTLRSTLAGILLTPAGSGGRPTTGGNGVASDLTTLGTLGISVQRDGTLALDAAKFQSVAGARVADATALLADRMGAVSSFLDTTAAPITGQIDTRSQAIDAKDSRLQRRIDDLDSRLDKRRTALLAQYSKYEAALGRLQSLQSSLTSQFSALNNSGSR